jgi:hypothetical protein
MDQGSAYADPRDHSGPITAGKNTITDLLAEHCVITGRTVVIADVDDVVAMVAGPGAGAVGLWLAAHQLTERSLASG